MRISVSVLLVFVLCGCAVGKITLRGDMVGVAFGVSKLSYCVQAEAGTQVNCCGEKCTAAPIMTPVQVCRTIEGGTISTGAVGFLEAVVSAVLSYFTAGAV